MAGLNSYEYATNDLKKDPLRALDLSNDVQLLADMITNNPNGEEQRADKNFKHLMDVEGYSPKEIAYNAVTNFAPDVAIGLSTKLLQPLGKTIGNVFTKPIKWLKNVKSKKALSKTGEDINKAIIEAGKVDLKKFKTNAFVDNLKKTDGAVDNEAIRDMLGDVVKNQENMAETNKAFRELKVERGKNDLAETFLEPFKKEDISNLKDDEYIKLLQAIPDRQNRSVAEAVDELKDIASTAEAIPNEERKFIGDIIRENNDTFRRNEERLNQLLKEKKLSPNKKFELDQLNKLKYKEATNQYIDDFLVDKYKKGNNFKSIPEYDAIRPYSKLGKKLLDGKGEKYIQEALKFFNLPETAEAVKKNKGKIALFAAIKGYKAYQDKIRDEAILPVLADMVHLDLKNPNRYNQKDIEGTWEILKRDWDNKEHPLPENPTPRQMINFIHDWVPKEQRKDIFKELTKGDDIDFAWNIYKKSTNWKGDDSNMSIKDKDRILATLSSDDKAALAEIAKDKDVYKKYDEYKKILSSYPEIENFGISKMSYKELDDFINSLNDEEKQYIKDKTGLEF